MKRNLLKEVESFNYVTNEHVGPVNRVPLTFSPTVAPVVARLAKPNDIDHKSSLVPEGVTRLEIADEMWIYLDESGSLHPDFVDMEQSAYDKIGSYSIKSSIADRLPTLTPYFENDKGFNPNHDSFMYAFEEMKGLIPKHSLRRAKLEDVYGASDKTTNWGYPYPSSGEDTCYKHYLLAKKIVTELVSPHLVSLLGWRGQPNGADLPKQRPVWMYPHSLVLVELTFLPDLQKALGRLDEFCMWKGKEYVFKPISRMLRKGVTTGQAVCGYDADSFDSSCSEPLIRAIFRLLKYWFQPEDAPLLDILCDALTQSGLMYAPGRVMSGRAGSMPSGSGFTNMIDCLIHSLSFRVTREDVIKDYIRKRNDVRRREGRASLSRQTIKTICTDIRNSSESVVMGDDGVWFLKKLTFDVLQNSQASMGFRCSSGKNTFRTDYVSFCQMHFVWDARDSDEIVKGVRSLNRGLNSMMSYERRSSFMRDPLYDSCRWLTQLEECKYHPKFKSFVRFIMGKDEVHRLGADRKDGPIGLFREFGFENFMDVRGKGFLYTSTVRKESDIDSLEVVKVIREIVAEDDLRNGGSSYPVHETK